MENIEQPFT